MAATPKRQRRPKNPKAAAARATEIAASQGKAWAVKALADGTVDKLDRSNQPPPRYAHGSTSCPCCLRPVWLELEITEDQYGPGVEAALVSAASDGDDAGRSVVNLSLHHHGPMAGPP